jgi:AraC-like DNA-binding protein
VALRFSYLVGDSDAVRITAEFAMTGLLRMLRQFMGERVRPVRVSFAYPAPAHAHEYRRVFEGSVCFGQPFTELVFPRAWLARPQLHGNPELQSLLQAHAERELAQLERGGTTGERVERVLALSDPRVLPTMQDVARDLDISSRTLARKLQLEGTSFVELVERRRGSAAKCLLEARRLSIQEVADAMGFGDAPAFHKAFRRWTGLTPKQYVASVER